MKALTLRQPWATLLVRGVKRFETRSWAWRAETHWNPEMRWYERDLPQRIAIHAAARFEGEDLEYARWLRDIVGCLDTVDLPTGAIVGTVLYVDWHYAYRDEIAKLAPSKLELELGDWSHGRILWECRDPIEFETPIAARGAQRLWNWLAPEYIGLEAAIAGQVGR